MSKYHYSGLCQPYPLEILVITTNDTSPKISIKVSAKYHKSISFQQKCPLLPEHLEYINQFFARFGHKNRHSSTSPTRLTSQKRPTYRSVQAFSVIPEGKSPSGQPCRCSLSTHARSHLQTHEESIVTTPWALDDQAVGIR